MNGDVARRQEGGVSNIAYIYSTEYQTQTESLHAKNNLNGNEQSQTHMGTTDR